jgi:hypothetical protein
MEHKADIEPGKIEGYCLGLPSTEENKAVEQQAQLHTGVKQEIDDFIREALQLTPICYIFYCCFVYIGCSANIILQIT